MTYKSGSDPRVNLSFQNMPLMNNSGLYMNLWTGIIHTIKLLSPGWRAGVRFMAGTGIFLIVITSRPALGPTQPPIEKCTESSFPGGKAAFA
jgi:hypothetical protein